MKVLNAIKWFTQRVTMLIYLPTVVVLLPCLLAQIGIVTKLWPWINSMYLEIPWVFWILTVGTRAIYSALWIIAGIYIWRYGLKWRFFWAKPDDSYYSNWHEENRDKTGTIVMIILVVVVCLFFAEVAISIFTGIRPVYLPPA